MKSFRTAMVATTLATLCGTGVAHAQEEDSSAAFKRANEAMGAALGIPAAGSTVITHDNGMISANLGVEHLKMLVVRQNPDGTFSYGHAANANDAEAFYRKAPTKLEEQ